MISNKIMKVYENKNAIIYRAMCDCSSVDCDLVLDIEHDSELNMIFINFYKNLSWSSYKYPHNSIMNLLYRIKYACKILFTGNIKVECEFLMKGNHVKDFIIALEEAKTKLEK